MKLMILEFCNSGHKHNTAHARVKFIFALIYTCPKVEIILKAVQIASSSYFV